jgi:glycosyltransferase involved in cell wall biosynthesis
MTKSTRKRVLIILYAGDYYDAYHRMINGLGEAYHHHNYALQEIAKLSTEEDVEAVAVLSCATQNAYDSCLDIGFRVIGTGFDPWQNPSKLVDIIEHFKPTHIVLRTPIAFIIKWSIQNRVKLITLLADSFEGRKLKSRFRHFRLARLLNHPQVEWVGNHHINSCLSLQKIGVSPKKIVPWDWPCEDTSPLDFEPKEIPGDKKNFSFSYVGSISESKGVGDLLEALALLKARGISASLNIAGKVKDDRFHHMAARLGIEDSVHFLGLVPNGKVPHLMRSADVVFIPSRHCYPEGLPLTIYEALCARTPIVASDHPMFLNNLKDGYSALIFPEKNPEAIAVCVERLLGNPELYCQLSKNTYQAWQQLQIPVTWADFIHGWVSGTSEAQRWLEKNSLTSEIYHHRRCS